MIVVLLPFACIAIAICAFAVELFVIRRSNQKPKHSNMNKIKSIILAAALILPVTALTPGCALFDQNATDQQRATQIHDLAYAAASIGTQAALMQNPSYRPAFEVAYNDLNQFVETKTISGLLLRNILSQLPVKELKSETARIAIENATVLYDASFGDRVNIENQAVLRAAAEGIRDGMKIALGH